MFLRRSLLSAFFPFLHLTHICGQAVAYEYPSTAETTIVGEKAANTPLKVHMGPAPFVSAWKTEELLYLIGLPQQGYPGQQLQIRELATSRLIGKLSIPDCSSGILTHTSEGICIIDRALGQVWKVRNFDGLEKVPLQSQALSASRSWLSTNVPRNNAPGFTSRSIAFVAHGMDAEDNVYALLGPFRRKEGATVLRFPLRGGYSESFRIEMPGTSDQPGLPGWLHCQGSQLSLIYRNGLCQTYTLQPQENPLSLTPSRTP